MTVVPVWPSRGRRVGGGVRRPTAARVLVAAAGGEGLAVGAEGDTLLTAPASLRRGAAAGSLALAHVPAARTVVVVAAGRRASVLPSGLKPRLDIAVVAALEGSGRAAVGARPTAARSSRRVAAAEATGLAVGAEGDAADRSQCDSSAGRQAEPAPAHVPEPHVASAAAGGEGLAVGAEGATPIQPSCASRRRADARCGATSPAARCCRPTAGGEGLAVGAEGHAHRRCRCGPRSGRAAGRWSVATSHSTHRVVVAAGGEGLAVGAEGDAH